MPILPIKGWWAGVEAAGNTSFCINEEDLIYENYIHCDSVSEIICLCYILFW